MRRSIATEQRKRVIPSDLNPERGFRAPDATTRIHDSDRVIGFNAQTGIYEDFFQAGIVDPTKMVCNALQVAASIAGLLITTEVAIAPLPGCEIAPPHVYGGEDF